MIALNQDLIMNTQANPNATAGQAASATSNDNFIDVSLIRIMSLRLIEVLSRSDFD